MKNHEKPTTKPRKRLYYNNALKALYYEKPCGSGVFTTDAKVEEKYKLVPLSSILTYKKGSPVNTKMMWQDLSFYPAHINQTYGTAPTALEPNTVYWYLIEDKQYLVYVTKINGYDGVVDISYRKIDNKGKLSKKEFEANCVWDEIFHLFKEPHENYVVETKVRLL